MINDRISQPTFVSRESGAGKAESTKSRMQYLAFMGGKPQAEGTSVQQQILESNPVIEAFGNAKLGIIILEREDFHHDLSFWKGHVFVKYLTQKGTTTAYPCCVLHHQKNCLQHSLSLKHTYSGL